MVLVDFRSAPIRVTATGAAPDDEVLDLGLYFNNLTLLITLLGLEGVGGGTTNVELTLETAMDPKGVWVTVDSFASLTTANTATKKTFTGLLRYVRWNITTLNNVTAATFTLNGIGRSS